MKLEHQSHILITSIYKFFLSKIYNNFSIFLEVNVADNWQTLVVLIVCSTNRYNH